MNLDLGAAPQYLRHSGITSFTRTATGTTVLLIALALLLLVPGIAMGNVALLVAAGAAASIALASLQSDYQRASQAAAQHQDN